MTKKSQTAFLLLLVFLAFLFSAEISAKVDLSKYKVVSKVRLSDDLSEISGLACTESEIIAINDSGKGSWVYRLNEKGLILDKYESKARNRDWEALAYDGEFLYVADIGNNYAKNHELYIYKHDLRVLKLSRHIQKIETILFKYADMEGENHKYSMMSHDLDAEALTIAENKLVLFSKSWKSLLTRVYVLNKESPLQLVNSVATVKGLPGVITGADYDAALRSYVVVGYDPKRLPGFSPYIAILNASFNLVETRPLHGFGQVESVCFGGGQSIWFAQESSLFKPASLIKMKPIYPNNQKMLGAAGT